jgi:hypothetical protein
VQGLQRVTKTIVDYTPPPTVRNFIADYIPGKLFYDFIVGPIGSGKTTGNFFKLVYMASKQAPDEDGIRRTKAVIVRNTLPQLRDTTIASWNEWFQDGVAGKWHATDKNFDLKFSDVECEVLFRPLDTAQDIGRVLSLDISFAIIDEFVNIPRAIVDGLSGRCGRYPRGRCTNRGMWGSSNPDTEDNWWYDYLHKDLPANAKYFPQPSGLAPDAENLWALPPHDGSAQYYLDQVIGKSDAWIHQFIHADWGFSISGTPVVPTFKPDLHLSKCPLLFNPNLKLVVGLDPGLGGSAFVFMQEDLHSRLNVLGELVQANMGPTRLINERLRPYLRARFPGAQVVIAPDPAAGNRSPSDEKEIVVEFRNPRHGFEVSIETNNRLPLRLNAIEYFTTRLTDVGPALLIDPKECPQLIRALKGGWRYAIGKKGEQEPAPDKNQWSHVGDSFGYGCRYHHKPHERQAKYEMQRASNRGYRPTPSGGYHAR